MTDEELLLSENIKLRTLVNQIKEDNKKYKEVTYSLLAVIETILDGKGDPAKFDSTYIKDPSRHKIWVNEILRNVRRDRRDIVEKFDLEKDIDERRNGTSCSSNASGTLDK